MGIRLEDEALQLTLEQALSLARSGKPLPTIWLDRVERLGELGVKTYIAALGGALLAKATNPEVDSLLQDENAGNGGYSLRRAAEFLALHNEGRYHLGAQGRWPLNNRPFLGGPSRIDEFKKISGRARPSYELFLDTLRDLRRRDEPEALEALAAFLRVRMQVQEEARTAAREARGVESDLAIADLVRVIDLFVHRDSEGGKRAQALTAAVLDCAFDEVDMGPINGPRAGDVRVLSNDRVIVAAEAKQLEAEDADATKLSSDAAELGADLALLVVLFKRHRSLDREALRQAALREDGTLLVICESVIELVTSVAVYSATPAAHIETELPGAYALRMREIEVSPAALEEWEHQIKARTGR
ncbi:MAG TPA: restriction endonuclease, SacI family [Solirubrobacterales bacterium]|nr:restriction endonuclease, SacI family [Solirubrobacterales bacterium]